MIIVLFIKIISIIDLGEKLKTFLNPPKIKSYTLIIFNNLKALLINNLIKKMVCQEKQLLNKNVIKSNI